MASEKQSKAIFAHLQIVHGAKQSKAKRFPQFADCACSKAKQSKAKRFPPFAGCARSKAKQSKAKRFPPFAGCARSKAKQSKAITGTAIRRLWMEIWRRAPLSE